MPTARYREGRGIHEDYLSPQQGDLGQLIGGAAMLAMMYTPVGGWLMRGALKSAKFGLGRAGALGKFAAKSAWASRAKIGSSLWGAGKGIGKATRLAAKPVAWMGRHRGAALAIGVGGAAILGGARGLRARAPYGENFTENVTYDESMRRGLAPDHLGATGDLTLALHGRR